VPFYLPLFLAFRYLFRSSGRGYLSLIAWFSLIGMALGVASLIIVTSVMNGFERQLQQRILNVVPHVFVEGNQLGKDTTISKTLANDTRVVGVEPYSQTQAMLSYDEALSGVVLNGVLPQTLANVSLIPDSVVVGDITSLEAGEFHVVIGAGIARQLGLYVGDKITLVLPKIIVSPAGAYPRSKRFVVTGIFQAGAQVDETEIYIHLRDMHRLLGVKEEQHGYRVQLNDVLSAGDYVQDIAPSLASDVQLKDWSHSHGSLFQAVKVEKVMVAVLLSIIVAVAAFNVVAVLTMMVINKRSAIAVLRTMGASQQQIIVTFISQGLLLGFIGMSVGVLIGLPIALNLTALMDWAGVSLFDSDVYYIASLPSVVNTAHVFMVLAFASLVSFAATIYPAYRASQIHPSEVLRYE